MDKHTKGEKKYPQWRKESLRHKLFGHIWEICYIKKNSKWRIIACYCSECNFGYDDLINFVKTHKHDAATYDETYF